MSEIKRVNSNPDFFEYMSAEEDNRKIENSIRKEMTERGLKEGLEKGLKQGIEQGIEQGTEQATKKIVISMLNQGLNPETIASYTGISIDKVLEVQSQKEV